MSACTAVVAPTDDVASVLIAVLPDGEVVDGDTTTKVAPSDSPEPDHSDGSVVEAAAMSDCSVEHEALPDEADEREVITDSVAEITAANLDKTDEGERIPDKTDGGEIIPDKKDGGEIISDKTDGGEIIPDKTDGGEIISDKTDGGEIIPDSVVEKTEASSDSAVETNAATPDGSSSDPASAEDSGRGQKRPIDPEDAKANVLTKVARTDASLGSLVAGHYNNLEEKGLAARNESRILHMRNFNNWIKSFLINKHMEEVRDGMSSGDQRVSVIDLGCGKGGDLLKWSKANIRHLVCVDIAETSVNQCKERFEFNKSKKYGAPRFSAEFIVADCTKVCFQPLLKDPSLKVQMVSCQFAFHYCFESLSQAETMIKNASNNLAKGGYFILTIPDANYIMKQLSRCGGGSFGNEVFRIEFPEDRPSEPPLFGDKYQFYLEGVVNCPEFLVHQPTLKRLCTKYGLSCVYQKRFSDVYAEALKDSQCRSLMHRMTALELFPSPNGSQSSSEPREYEPAQDHLKEKDVSSVLTLSASEWDAIRVYTAFAFKKG